MDERFRNGCGLPIPFFLLLIFLAGCARLPAGVAVQPEEQESVEASYRRWQADQRECPSSLDAAVTVTMRAWLRSGTLSGFVQAMEPAFLNFIALNPLGQPMLMLASDGLWFRLISVPESRSYEGSVKAEAFENYAPEGTRIEQAFFWLTARVPPQVSRIIGMARDEKAALYWLDLAGEEGLRHRVLFDPRRKILHRHQVVDEWRSVLVDVRYDNFEGVTAEGPPPCLLPGTIVIETRRHRGRMVIELTDWLTADLLPGDFSLEPPAGFERVRVNGR